MADKTRADLLQLATAEIRRLRADNARYVAMQREPIAIVGMACRFPGGAHSPEQFWQLLHAGRDAVVDVGPRWEALGVADQYDASTAPRWAALLDTACVQRFDADFFGISNREADKLDPQQRLLLEVAYEALERAGMPLPNLRNSATGVYVGMLYHDFEHILIDAQQQRDVYAVTGVGNCFAAGRLSYALGLQGPSLTVDTACSSSLVALHLACHSLRQGETDAALVGGANLLLSPMTMDMVGQTQALAPDGRCKTFDARANGYVRGEGAAVVVLKRLRDAQQAGDRVLALIRGSAVNQDGASNGLTAPNGMAQEAVLRQALEHAQVQASQVDCVEAHGTGTALGDPIEMDALRAVYGAPRPDGTSAVVGSVKTNIGHLESTAGMAALFKVVLALQHGHIPPHLHFEAANPLMRLQGTALHIDPKGRPWPRGERVRLAGISGFALSGTNAHVIVEEAPVADVAAVADQDSTEVLVLSARSQAALQQSAADAAAWLQQHPHDAPRDIARSAALRRTHHAHRLAVVGNGAQWRDALEAYARDPREGGTCAFEAAPRGRVVFVYPGQGSQWLGMGRELLAQEPLFRATLEACDVAIAAHSDVSVLRALQTPDAALLQDVNVVQPLLFALQVGLTALWRAWGVTPDAVVGHSMGEVAAAWAAGALDLPDAAQVITLRSRLVRQARGGAMLVAELPPAEAETRLAAYQGALSIAAYNGGNAVVIAGDAAPMDALEQALSRDGHFCRRVKVDYASHSPHMDALSPLIARGLAGLQPRPASLPFYSTVTGAVMPQGHDGAYWARNLRQPVLFGRAVHSLWQAGHRVFVEISPHPVLLTGPEAILRALEPTASGAVVASTLRREQPERATFLGNVAALHCQGVPVDWQQAYGGAGAWVDLPTYPWQRQTHWPQRRRAPRRSRATHPLLGTPISLASDANTLGWELQLDRDSLPYGQEHRVGDVAVLPGAVWMEMFLAAAHQHQPGAGLQQVRFHAALVVPESDTLRLQVVRQGDTLQAFSWQNNGWTLHADCRLMAAPAPPPEALTLPTPPALQITADAFYARAAATGLHYGPAFQRLHSGWATPEGGWAQLIAPPQDSACSVHPTVLDAALHSGFLQVWQAFPERAQQTWLPAGVQQVQVYHRATGAAWSHTRLRRDGDDLLGDVQLCDSHGRVLMALVGVRLQQAAARPRAHEALFLHTTWQALPAPAAGAPVGAWLVVGDNDDHGFAAALTTALRQRGHSVTCVDSNAPLPVAMPWRGVVHLGSLTAPTLVDAESMHSTWQRTCHSVVHLVRHLGSETPRLWLVTRQSQRVLPDDPIDLQGTPLWGLGRTLAYEHPQLRSILVDVRFNATQVQAMADALAAELQADTAEDELALRPHGGRFAARLQQSREIPRATETATPLRADATYLITGGLGGLGLALARWMLQEGAGHVVLSGRHGIQNDSQRQGVAQLAAMGRGQVHVLPADVSQQDSINALLLRLRSTLPPLKGVVHAAAVLDDALMEDQTPDRMRRVMAPKALGAWHLHQLTDDLDFFILYGSAAGLLGSPGQSNYAAANSFLAGLAAHRQAHGLPGLCIDWGAFAEVGLAAAQDNRGARIQERGMRNLLPDEGCALVGQLLMGAPAHIGVVPLDPVAWARAYPQLQRSPRLQAILAGTPSDSAPSFAEQLRSAPAEQHGALLEELVRDELAKVLRTRAALIDPARPFKGLGLDSLLALELRNRLEAALGLGRGKRPLPVSAVMQPGASIVTLATALAGLLSNTVSPSDAVSFARIHGEQPTRVRADDLRLQRFVPNLTAAPSPDPPGPRVLLTGATGFLGRFVLMELLRRAPVTCVVRAADDAAAMARLRDTLQDTPLWPQIQAHQDNLTVLAGDITRPNLGLAPASYEQLSHSLHSIVHGGALVNHAFTYAQLFDANVLGTAELMGLCLHGPRKRFNFVSSVAVFNGLSRLTGVSEDENAASLWPERPLVDDYASGYGTSKWAGEVLLQQLSVAAQVPVNIFRCGLMLPSSQHLGQINASDFFARLLCGVVYTRLAPDSFFAGGRGHAEPFDGLPVDFAAARMADIAMQPHTGLRHFHVINQQPQSASLDHIVDCVHAAGYGVQHVSDFATWFQRFKAALEALPSQQRQQSPLPAMHLWQQPRSRSVPVDTTQFVAAARQHGADMPVVDAAYVRQCLAHLVHLGLIDPADALAKPPT